MNNNVILDNGFKNVRNIIAVKYATYAVKKRLKTEKSQARRDSNP